MYHWLLQHITKIIQEGPFYLLFQVHLNLTCNRASLLPCPFKEKHPLHIRYAQLKMPKLSHHTRNNYGNSTWKGTVRPKQTSATSMAYPCMQWDKISCTDSSCCLGSVITWRKRGKCIQSQGLNRASTKSCPVLFQNWCDHISQNVHTLRWTSNICRKDL